MIFFMENDKQIYKIVRFKFFYKTCYYHIRLNLQYPEQSRKSGNFANKKTRKRTLHTRMS